MAIIKSICKKQVNLKTLLKIKKELSCTEKIKLKQPGNGKKLLI